MIRFDEFENCPVENCNGTIHLPDVEGCCCHISPPCTACVNTEFKCDICGITEQEYEELDN